MQLLNEYFALQKLIYDHFGYVENWRVIPLDDRTMGFWMLVGGEGVGGTVVWSSAPFNRERIKEGSCIYSGSIYTQRFLSKWTFRAEDFTMICVDTQTDDNKLLMVFDNENECKDDAMRQLYLENWQ